MEYILDASVMEDKKSTHEYIKKTLKFPDYYGCNLDALYDCLTDLDDEVIHFVNVSKAGEYFGRVKGVFDDVLQDSGRITVIYDDGDEI